MSANARVAGRGGRANQGKNRARRGGSSPFPSRKQHVSNHPDAAMKQATFNIGQTADAAQYVKSIETFVEFLSRSDRSFADELRQVLAGDLATLPAIRDPARPTAQEIQADPLEEKIYLDDRRTAIKERKKLDAELKQLYGELWEQCSIELRAKLKGETGFAAIEAAHNPLLLRNRIKKHCCGFEDHKMKYYNLVQAIKKYVLFYQRPNMSNEQYKREDEALFDSIEQFGGTLVNHPILIQAEANAMAEANGRLDANGDPAPNGADMALATNLVRNKIKACFMLSGAHNERFRPLKDHLENPYIMGSDQYPDDTEALLGMMNNFRIAPNQYAARHNRGADGDDDGVAFVQEGTEDKDEDGEESGTNMAQKGNAKPKQKANIKSPDYPFKDRKCYHCNNERVEEGHIARDCPELEEKDMGQIHAQFGIGLLQGKSPMVKPNYLYLDTCTTNNFMCNSTYLTGVHKASSTLRLQTNGGSTTTDQQGYLGSMKMWLGKTGIANVVSLKELEDHCHKQGGYLSYRSDKDKGAVTAHLGDGKTIQFKRCPETDFPYIDLDDHMNDGAVMLIQTVRKNMEGFTKREVKRAIHARDTQAMMGYVSEKDLKTEVSRPLLSSSTVTATDIANANSIFGPCHHTIRGKARRQKPTRVEPEYLSIPQTIVDRCKYVTLVGDVMFVCGLPFFITLSRGIRFGTAQFRPRRTAKLLCNALKETIKIYKRAGFIVQTCLMDNEFEALKPLLADTCVINTTAKNEHVHEIERFIQTIKGKCRCITSELRESGITHLPYLIIKSLITFIMMMNNALLAENGVSETLSPREIILRWQLDAKRHMKARFGSYCEVFEDDDITNTQKARACWGICMGPTGNMQGTYKFFNLDTGKLIKRRSFKVLPTPDRVIKQLNDWGIKNGKEAKLLFRDRNQERFSWDTEDDEGPDLIDDNAVELPTAPYPDIPAEMPGVVMERDLPVTAVEDDAPPEDEVVAAEVAGATDYANFGPSDNAAAVVEANNGEVGAQHDVVYNITVDLPHAVPAADDEIANEHASDAASQQEWDGNNNIAPPDEIPSAPEDEGLPDQDIDDDDTEDDTDTQDLPYQMHGTTRPEARVEGQTRSGRNVRRRDVYTYNMFSACKGLSKGIRRAFKTENEEEETRENLEINKKEMANKVMANRRKKRVAGVKPMSVPVRAVHRAKAEAELEAARAAKRKDDEIMAACRERVDEMLKKAEAAQDKNEEVDLSPIEVEDATLFGIILSQLSLKQGIRHFGKEKAEKSIMKEYKMLHDLKCFIPRDPESLTKEERVRALSTVVFMKEKRDGTIKTRSCVNGAPQREYIKKEDAASPTVSTDGVFLTTTIAAHEERDVMTCDIPGAFVNTRTDEFVIMTLRGELCEIMARIDPKLYRKHITKDKKGKPVLYVQLFKSLYGLLRSALLFYKKLKGELEEYGFEMNPYDPCVFNKITEDGNQHTVIFHVDDVLATHKDPRENTKLLKYLNNIYGDELTFNRGKKFDYLGMDLDFSKKKVLQVSMIPYIKNIIEEFPELIDRTSPTPAAEYLFKIREENERTLLGEDQAMKFHRTVAQLLFLCMRARRDIQTAVAFLTTRVKAPDEDDWGKVKRVLQYLKGTMSLKLTLSIDNLQCTRWLVDSSHGVHWDCKGHTGAAMTLGNGATISFSHKHKQNARSSTEAELLGVDDAMPQVLWSLNFLRAQGYDVNHALIYQDNRSAILLEVNGKLSSSKRTKHIKMKFFFVKDQVDQGEVKIEHLGTEDMWVDVLPKPKQGKAFRKDRAKLMNCPVDWQEPGQTCSEVGREVEASPKKNVVLPILPKPQVTVPRQALKNISNGRPMPMRAIHAS